MASRVEHEVNPGASETDAAQVMLAAKVANAAERQALAAAMLAARQVKVTAGNRVPRRVYWWVLGAGSGIGLAVFGGMHVLSHPATAAQQATSACERSVQSQLQSSEPAQFADVRSRRTGPGAYTIDGTAMTVDALGAPTVWTCVASSGGSTWTARADLL